MGIDIDSPELGTSVAVLEALSDRLPAHAQAAIEDAMGDAPGLDGSIPDSVPARAADASDPSQASSVMPVDPPA